MTTGNLSAKAGLRLPSRTFALALASAAFLLFGADRAAAADTLQVAPSGTDAGNCVVAACKTIGYAVGQAGTGDTIEVAAGNYAEQVAVTVAGLTIAGNPAGGTIVGPEGSGVVSGTEFTLAGGVDGVTLRDLKVVSRAQDKPAILVEGAGAVDDLTLDGVAVVGIGPSTPPTTVANGLEIRAPGTGLKILDSHFEDNYLGVAVYSDLEDVTVEGASFEGNRVGFNVQRATPLTPTSPGEIDGLEMRDSSFDANEYNGLFIEGLSEATIDEVSVTDTGVGMASIPNGARALVLSLKAGEAGSIAITDSDFSGSRQEGIVLQARGWSGDSPEYEAAPASLDSFSLTGSTISGNGGPSVIVNNRSTLGAVEIHGNRIVDNGTAAFNATAPVDGVWARNEAPGAPTVDADENWFACNEGPATPGCANVNAPVQAPAWLVLTVGTAFETLRPGQQTAVVAAIESSAGGDPLLPFPAGAEATFSSGLGSFEPSSEPLLSGVASPTFTAGSTLGSGVVIASVDGEQATAPMTVLAPETVPEPTPPATPPPPAPPAPTPPAAPTIDPAGGKAPTVVPSSGNVSVATIACAAESCAVKAQGTPSVKIGGVSYPVQVKLPKNLRAGDTGKVRVVLPRKVREALAEEGKGKLKLKLKVTGSDGSAKTVTVTIVLKGKGAKAKAG